jgi:predicted esterase
MMHFAGLILASIGIAAATTGQVADTPEAVLTRLSARVDSLLQQEQPPLFAWHLRSLKALAQSEYAKLALQSVPGRRRAPSDRAKEFVEYAGQIESGLRKDHANSDDCLKNGVGTLILARASSVDGSLQYMMVGLPKGWDPNRAYPLDIGLHGSGPDNPLAYPSFGFGPVTPPAPDAAPKPGDGMIHLTPWGRGNRSWRGDAESDLWEAIALLQTFCKLDHDRWYISGHSSGADGTWAIVQHTPDLWAAVGIQSGSMLEGRPEWGLIPNMKYVPVYFLIGEKDPLPYRVPDMKEAFKILSKMGDDTKLSILPGVGHYPLTEAGLNDQFAWMITHVRKRPNHFVFTIDQAQHPGVWGITVPFDQTQRRLLMQPWPAFECEIDGQEVHIKTKHIKRMTIDLGPQGLRMSGAVKVWVNGKSVLDGPIPDTPLRIEKV